MKIQPLRVLQIGIKFRHFQIKEIIYTITLVTKRKINIRWDNGWMSFNYEDVKNYFKLGVWIRVK